MLLVSMAKQHKKFIASQADHGFLSPHLAHEEARQLDQYFVPGLVAMAVVILLKVINVDENAAPRAGKGLAGNFKHGKIAAVEAARQRIANALLAELVFQLLVGGDIHEDAMIESFAALRVFTGVSSIEHRASVAVGALDLQLEFADVAVTLEDPLLPGADLSVGKVGDQVTAQFLDRWNAKNVEQCLVAIHKSALLVGDVDSLFEVLH